MKKILCLALSLAMALMMSVALTGCGEDETAAVKETVDGCLTAMQEGDFEKVKEYCSEDVFDKSGSLSNYNEFDELTKSLTDSLGIDEADLSDEAKASVDKFKEDFLTKLIDSYEIGDITIDEDGKATANVSMKYGLDVDKLSKIDFSKMDDSQKIVQDYVTKHQDEFVKLYQEKGEKAAMTKLVNDLLPQLMDMLSDKMFTEAAGSTEEDSVISLEKNDDGKWLVTEMNAKK